MLFRQGEGGGKEGYADPSSAGTLCRPEVRFGSEPNWNHAEKKGKEPRGVGFMYKINLRPGAVIASVVQRHIRDGIKNTADIFIHICLHTNTLTPLQKDAHPKNRPLCIRHRLALQNDYITRIRNERYINK